MSSDARTSQPHLTPEQRRDMLRAFADRMLLKISAMDDPEDLPGVERAVRTAAVIERLYRSCDRAEHQTPDPRKLRVERAQYEKDAFHAQSSLAEHLKWRPKRRRQLGNWWDEAGKAMEAPKSALSDTLPVPETGTDAQPPP